MPSSLTHRLVKLIRQKPIDQADLDAAALFTLDALANAVAGRSSDAGKIILQWVKDRRVDEGRCAFALGALTHIVEMDDLHRTSVTHPGCVVIPAVIALGIHSGKSGHEILKAVLHGFEACTRVGMAVGAEHYKIWHNTATCGPFGSAMAVSGLLGLNDEQTVNALGNAGTQSSGFWQFLQTGAMSKHLHAARAAESGLLATQLAALGFSGPDAILEGEKGFFAGMCPNPEPAALTQDEASAWQLHLTSIKPWPSCRHTHPVIDAALELAGKFDLKAVNKISIQTYQAALNVCNRPQPESLYEAKFSLQHCVLAALYDGRIDFDSFNRQSRQNLADKTGRVSISVTDKYESAYPQAWGACVSVDLDDGRSMSAERRQCRGDPENPLHQDELIDKAQMLMAYGSMDEKQTQELIHGVLALANNKSLSAQVISSVLN